MPGNTLKTMMVYQMTYRSMELFAPRSHLRIDFDGALSLQSVGVRGIEARTGLVGLPDGRAANPTAQWGLPHATRRCIQKQSGR